MSKPSKLLFLDVDGVLNSARSVAVRIGPAEDSPQAAVLWDFARDDCEDRPELGTLNALRIVDPVCVALVNRLLVHPDVGLVLSSSHRTFLHNSIAPYGSPAHLSRLRAYLTAMGLQVPEFFSVTPVLHGKRGEEIHAWLTTHAEEVGLDADGDRYAILDDAGEMLLPGQPLVLCDATQGVSLKNYAQCCRLLGLKEPRSVLL